MPVRIVLTALVSFLVAGLGWAAAAPADNPVLFGKVGPDFTISLKDAAGRNVTHLDAGMYTVKVDDEGEIHNFNLVGPGVDEETPIEGIGDFTWTVNLIDGTYTYRCLPHSTIMHGEFTVGTATPPPTTTPTPTTTKLSGRVGPGAKISFPAKAKAGKAQITIRDLTAADNFHLVGAGVNKKTGVKFKGTVTWSVTLKKGVYAFRSDAHARLRGKTTVT